MFEDSLMESGNRIKAKSKYWSILTFLLNGGALIALIIWPLLHPEALPKQIMAELMVAPPAPPPPPPRAQAPKVQNRPEILTEVVQAPSRIPKEGRPQQELAIPPSIGVGIPGADTLDSISGVIGSIGTGPVVAVSQTPRRTVSISSGVMAGYLLEKTLPQYPPIPKIARIQGIVVLQATISKTGLIQNLRVISGPAMLQQAALDAVRSWRYKPYLLNGEPVEVETTVNVKFNLGE
jgi:periplasmic protein TonB